MAAGFDLYPFVIGELGFRVIERCRPFRQCRQGIQFRQRGSQPLQARQILRQVIEQPFV